MPANLPPEYFRIETTLREAKTPLEKIEVCEKLLAVIPRHKGTEKLVALYKSKIAKFREEAQKKPSTARRGPLGRVEASGAGQVVVTGPPNAGKSSLVKALTGAEVEVADYPFSTRVPSPFMMPFENVKVQLVDTPPVTSEFVEPWFPEMLKTADAVLLVADLGDADTASLLDGIVAKLREKKVELAAADAKIPPEKGPFLKRTLLVANKADLDPDGRAFAELRVLLEGPIERLAVSALTGFHLHELKHRVFSLLHVVRAHSKVPGKKAELDSPFALRKGSTVLDMARAVHKDFAENLDFARVWSKDGTIDGLRVNRDHVLNDEDIVELHI
jgi:ribosome-interacting GTPase 1